MKKRLIPLVFFSGAVFAQERTVSSGGDASGSGGNIAFTIGVIDYTNSSGTDGAVTLGVQQPYELFSASLEESNQDWNITVFPNPFTSYITVEFPDHVDGVTYVLHDEQGRTVQSGEISSPQGTIELSKLAMSSYHLSILVKNEQVRKYHLIKNN